MKSQTHRNQITFIILIIICILIASCSSGGNPSQNATNTTTSPPEEIPTSTPEITIPPEPTATEQRIPPALPQIYYPSYLAWNVTPHIYINDVCQYLNMKWNPNNSEPGTVVMVIMFHSIKKPGDELTNPNQISLSDFKKLMSGLKDQGFEAINAEQLANFLETNAWIPPRSVLLIADDRHYAKYFDSRFRKYWEDWGWQVVNAWISHPDTPDSWYAENEPFALEGMIDYQAHGVIHNTYMSESSTDEYILSELQGSMVAIQEHYGKPPIAIIWPGGGFTTRTAQIARQVGYRLGFTINPRGPIMFNWVPLADERDPNSPVWLQEGPVGDPLLVLPRYWPYDVLPNLDLVRTIGKEAASYAEQNKQIELEFYDIVCKPTLGEIPQPIP